MSKRRIDIKGAGSKYTLGNIEIIDNFPHLITKVYRNFIVVRKCTDKEIEKLSKSLEEDIRRKKLEEFEKNYPTEYKRYVGLRKLVWDFKLNSLLSYTNLFSNLMDDFNAPVSKKNPYGATDEEMRMWNYEKEIKKLEGMYL